MKYYRGIVESDVDPLIEGILRKLKIRLGRFKCNSSTREEIAFRFRWLRPEIAKQINSFLFLNVSNGIPKKRVLMLIGIESFEIIDNEIRIWREIKIHSRDDDRYLLNTVDLRSDASRKRSPNLDNYDK